VERDRHVEVARRREERIVRRVAVRQAVEREWQQEAAAGARCTARRSSAAAAFASPSVRCAIGSRRPPLPAQNPSIQRL
jgi:hypothetical protein